MQIDLPTAPTNDAFIARSVDFLTDAITDAIEERGQCILGLSGGKTPHEIYTALGQAQTIEWGRVYLFLIDERCVPSTSPESNLHLLETTLLRYGAIDRIEHCTFPDTTLAPAACAAAYDRTLHHLFDHIGTPDLLVLGLGTDGHTASLFPPVPLEAFGMAYALHTIAPDAAVRDRISMTIPPLHQAHKQCFFLKGEEKKKVWDEMMASEEGPERWPAKGIMAFGETTVIAQW